MPVLTPPLNPCGPSALEQLQWYAIQTYSRHEKKVATQVQEKGIYTFLPLVTQVHRWSDRRKIVQVPLFRGYVFVQIVCSAEIRLCVLQTAGVARFVGIQGRGIPIPDKQIESIRTLLEQDVPFAPYPFLRVGQRVRIRGGSLDGIEGILVAKNSDRSLVVSVDLIRRSLAIRVAGYDVEAV